METVPSYLDVNACLNERVSDLMDRMTFEEKVAQVCAVSLRDSTAEEEGLAGKVKAVREGIRYGIGQIENTFDPRTAREAVEEVNELQRILKEETRLGIPALVGSECAHGHAGYNSTVFPVPLAMASSWNTDLVEKAFDCAGRESRLRASHEAHTPVLDLGRDPRWGRIEETFGEDTYLVGQMGLAAVTGLQGGKEGDPGRTHVVAAPKHFAGYGQVVGGRNFAATPIDWRTLHDEVLPPFKTVVKEGNVLGMMASHCEVEGVPAHGNRWLLTDLLRKEWGFEGYVVSDYNDVPRLAFFQKVVGSIEEAAGLALCAGLDLDLPVCEAYGRLAKVIDKRPELVESLDLSVSRILRLKFKLGLFEDPFVDPQEADAGVGSREHVELAALLASESITLLKNKEEFLPLKANALKSIAVIGPNAAAREIGNYTAANDRAGCILDGIRAAAGEVVEVAHETGCVIPSVDWDGNQSILQGPSLEEETSDIDRAVALAEKSDVAVLCLGGSTETSREAFFVDGIKGDRSTLNLLGNQEILFRKVKATGTPIVVILMGGRPYSIPEVYAGARAVLNTFYLGEGLGTAIAKVLFGEVNPSGRLPVTIPRSAGQLPMYYSQKRISFYKDYLDEEPGPLFPFGYGLSYTRFEYSDLRLENAEINEADDLRFTLKVANRGSVEGSEVVQIYLRDQIASVLRPDKLLVRFVKVALQVGEEKTLKFSLNPIQDMSFTGIDGERCVEAGRFDLEIGSSSVDVRLKESFELMK